ncbi:MAG: class I SAM-dependent rRNA methyltransferase [Elusimicrobiota bacterium]|jgi:23S rRNA (cytosine1962-C5)-methyltransferase|nr:class I SAM-dependent rRNA methyltransferase [Elusimicrobiota bacterium]
MNKIFLKASEGKRIKGGHKWVFSNEIKSIEGRPVAGEIVALYDSNNSFLGSGFYNPNSLISFRLISKTQENIDVFFWTQKILKAKLLRERVYPNAKSYRVVFSESDDIPGFVLDKYEDYLCVQFVCAGADTCKDDILKAAKNVFEPKGIIIKNDNHLRKLENLPLENQIYFGEIPKNVKIDENGIKFHVDLINGQKTGFFFDQRDNRQKFCAYVKDKKILDCFCHTGAFGIYAKKAGAKDVVFVDSSFAALEIAENNYALNGFESFNGISADALEYMQSQESASEKFDIINIDPPGLIKSRKDFNAGFRHYVKVNAAAMNLLKSHSILTTSSCSHHLSFKDFKEVINQSCAKAKKQAVILEYGFQAKDHPILVSMPETEYLKFAVVEIF